MTEDTRVWFHAVLTTYGAWLHGDSRGFRTRHHREHVHGDYKNPPAEGKYTARESSCRNSMKQDAVVFPPNLRRFVGEALKDKLNSLGAWVLIEAVSGQHVHMIIKLPPQLVRKWLGIAKKHTSFELKKNQWNGKVWGVRCRADRVRNKVHQTNTFRYIERHRQHGAWVGIWKTPPE